MTQQRRNRTVPRDRHNGSRVPRSSPPRRSVAVGSKFCRRDSNLMVKIDSIRHFLRHYALTILMIGQKITYPYLYCHYISKNSLYYVNFLHHNKDAEPCIYSRLCVLRQFSAGTNLYLNLVFEFLNINLPVSHLFPFFHLIFCVSVINLFFLIIRVSL